jgi:hypothetical protein
MKEKSLLKAIEKMNEKAQKSGKPSTDLEIAITLFWQLIVCENKQKKVVKSLFKVLNKG